MANRGISKLFTRPTLAVVLRYGLAVLLVGIALAITLIMHLHNSPPRFVSHFVLLAIAITFWFAGTGPGLLAFLLSCLGVSLFAKNNILLPGFPLWPFLSFFSIFSLLMGWFAASRRRAQKQLTEARDTLELRVAERTTELQRSEKELRELIDTIPATVWIALPDGSNAYVNRRFIEYSGISAEQAAGSGWKAVTHPDDLQQHVGKWMESVATGKPHENEVRFRRSDGQYRWHLNRGVPLRDEDGKIIKWYGVLTDIEDRKRAEDALRRSEAYLAEAQRVSHMGSWVWNVADRSAVHLSEEFYRVCGFDPTDGPPTWEKWIERIHPEDRLKWKGGVERAILERTDYEEEFRIVLPGGIVRWIRTVGHPVLTAAGVLVQFIGSSTDITERKRAEEERERLHQLEADLAHINRVSMMGELAASLAHEIKQPIAAAVTNAEACLHWIARDQPDLVEAHEAATETVDEARRAADIITRIHSLFRKEQPRREPLDINEVISEMVSIVREEARRHSISLRTLLCSNLPSVSADRIQLEQVLMNLMLNGIEAMRAMHGELTIKTQRDEHGHVLISVSDIGAGLPAENVAKIFDAFFTTKAQGTGMGLAISRSIIESHGGRIWATANAGEEQPSTACYRTK